MQSIIDLKKNVLVNFDGKKFFKYLRSKKFCEDKNSRIFTRFEALDFVAKNGVNRSKQSMNIILVSLSARHCLKSLFRKHAWMQYSEKRK